MHTSSSFTVQDLVASIPDMERGAVRGRQRWRAFTVVDWPEAWKRAALNLELFETSDFKSLANTWHDQDVAAGKKIGPYQGNSHFKGWWDGRIASAKTDDDPFGVAPVHEAFEVLLVTDVTDQRVLGLMVFERFARGVQHVPEIPMDARCKPRFTVPVRVLGQANFWVSPEHRGQGLGTNLATALIDRLVPEVRAAYEQDAAMPFLVARDRAFNLLERLSPWPLVEQSSFNYGQRRDMLREAIHHRDHWPEWVVPLTDLPKAAPKPRSRSRMR